ncbi:MAG: UDP-2,3-diacylglucosamine diphosphatase [Candidatus Cloacimonetes bacterium]|nr:UDP-2,3-diacylglucosamine diphosphatase [Candidatus Cloacimonadota bacterium]
MRVYIVSDFHLKFSDNPEDLEQQDRVITFLNSLIGKADLLILNGDIFDLWFVWKTVIIKSYFPILKKFADLRESGCRIVFIAGNHDFWFRDFLVNILGIEVYNNNFIETIDGVKIFVSHGDLYTSNDMRYKIFRSIIRNRIVMKLFEMFHPDFALGLGKMLSRTSRKRKISITIYKKKERGLIDFAKKQFKNYDIVVMGHSHLPKLEKYENGIYANAGDWIINNSFLKIIDGNIELCKYKINRRRENE